MSNEKDPNKVENDDEKLFRIRMDSDIEAALRYKKKMDLEEAERAAKLRSFRYGTFGQPERGSLGELDKIGITARNPYVGYGSNDNLLALMSQPIEIIQSKSAAPLTPGQKIMADSVANIGQGASEGRLKSVAKVLGGMAVPLLTTMATKAMITTAATTFFPMYAPIIVPTIFLLWSSYKLAQSAIRIKTEIDKSRYELNQQGITGTRAFFLAINQNKFKTGMMLGSAIVLALGATNTLDHLNHAIVESFRGTAIAEHVTRDMPRMDIMLKPGQHTFHLPGYDAHGPIPVAPGASAVDINVPPTRFDMPATTVDTHTPAGSPAIGSPHTTTMTVPEHAASAAAPAHAASAAVPASAPASGVPIVATPHVDTPIYEAGHAPSATISPQDQLRSFVEGKDVSKQVHEAIEKMSSTNPAVAAQGTKDAAFFLINHRGIEGNAELAVNLLKDAADHGNVQAKVDLAYLQYHGLSGVAADHKTALAAMQEIKGSTRAHEFVQAWTGHHQPPSVEVTDKVKFNYVPEPKLPEGVSPDAPLDSKFATQQPQTIATAAPQQTFAEKLATAKAHALSTDTDTAMKGMAEYKELMKQAPAGTQGIGIKPIKI